LNDEIFRLCQMLRPIIGAQAETLWKYYDLADSHQARMQSAQLIKMVASHYLGSDLDKDCIRLPSPSFDAARGALDLGRAVFLGKDRGLVGLNMDELAKHIGVFGTTGSGKTTLVWNLMRELQQIGLPFLAIDWKRSYRSLKQLEGFKEIKVYTLGRSTAPLNWNPLQPPPGTDFATWSAILAEIFERSHVGGQGVAEIFIEACLHEHNGDTAASAPLCPILSDVRDRVERTRQTGRRALWRDSCLRILRTFTCGPLAKALNSRNGILLNDLLQQPTVVELDLSLPANIRTFLSEAMLRWIHLFRLSQGETQEPRHMIILEEAHNILRQDTNSGAENLYRELRSFGQGLIAVTQHPSQLPIYVLGNTHTVVFMQLTHETDIIAARQALFLERGQERFLDLLKTGEGILKIKGRLPATHVRFPLLNIQGKHLADQKLQSQ